MSATDYFLSERELNYVQSANKKKVQVGTKFLVINSLQKHTLYAICSRDATYHLIAVNCAKINSKLEE